MGMTISSVGRRSALGLLLAGLFMWAATATQAQSVLVNIPVGTGPSRVAVNSTTNRVYVTNQFTNNVTVVDGASNSPVTSVTVGTNPVGVAVHPGINRIYVANFSVASSSITVIDGASNIPITNIPIAAGPPALVAINPTTNRGYATLPNQDRVVVFDTTTNTLIGAPIPVGTFPTGIAVNPVTNTIYTANQVSNNVTVINGATNTVVTTVPAGAGAFGVGANPIVANPATNRVYVANFGSNNVTVIDGNSNTVVTTLTVGANPLEVGVNSANNRVYVTNNGSNSVSIIDAATNTVVATVFVQISPQGVAANPVTSRAYVANNGSNTLSVIQDISPPTATPTRTSTATVTSTATATATVTSTATATTTATTTATVTTTVAATATVTATATGAPVPPVVPPVPAPPSSGQAGVPCTTIQNGTCTVTGAASGTFTLNNPNRITVTATGSAGVAPGSTPRIFIPTTTGVETFLCTPVGLAAPFTTTCTGTTVGTPLQGATVTVRFALIGGLLTQDVTGIVNGPGPGLTVAQAIALVQPTGQQVGCALLVGQTCQVTGTVSGNGTVTGSMQWNLTVPVPAGVVAGVVPVAVFSTTQGLQGFLCAPVVAGAGTVACVGTTVGNALQGSTVTVVFAPGVTAVGVVNGAPTLPLLPPLPPPPPPLPPPFLLPPPAPPFALAAAAPLPEVPVIPEADTLPLVLGSVVALGALWLSRARRPRDP